LNDENFGHNSYKGMLIKSQKKSLLNTSEITNLCDHTGLSTSVVSRRDKLLDASTLNKH